MPRELSPREIIDAGRAYETYAVWERARAFTWSLYGPSAARVTYSQTTFPESDHRLRTMQMLAFDTAGQPLPYDFTASWWAACDLPEDVLASATELARMDLARGLGSSLPEALREDLRAYAEETLGVETLHTWLAWNESETLTWMFDLTAPPLLPFATITDSAGTPLASADIIAAGQDYEQRAHWEGVREYVHTLYGNRAAKVDVTAFSRYNDFTYNRDIRLDVFDSAGTRLFYDLRLPWWERFAFTEREVARYIAEHSPTEEYPLDMEYDPAIGYLRANAEIQRLATLLLGADFVETHNSWDTDTVSYDLSQPPALRYPHL